MTAPHPGAALSAREVLTEARAWVEHSFAQLRPLSPAACEPGEALLKKIDTVLSLSTAHTATAGDGGETDEEIDERIARQGARENMRLIDSISDLIGLPHNVELELHHVREALTQAPAVQAPAGEDEHRLRSSDQLRILAGYHGDKLPKGMTNELCGLADEWDDQVDELRFAASPTPTDAQPKAARPVGGEALREALNRLVSAQDALKEVGKACLKAYAIEPRGYRRIYEMDAAYRAKEKAEQEKEAAVQGLITLASHPTTGQDTGSAPRDGQVRGALVEILWKNFGPRYGGGAYQVGARVDWCYRDLHPADMRKLHAVASEIAALSAPGSAGLGESRAYGTDWAAEIANGLVGKAGDDVAAALRHASACGYTEGYGAGKNYEQAKVATPSPAQEPGTGDTGEIVVDVMTMQTPRGPDFFVRITCGGRSQTPHVFRERFKAEYEAAHLQWVLGLRPDEPDLMAYDEASHPNDPTPATTAETRGPAEGAR